MIVRTVASTSPQSVLMLKNRRSRMARTYVVFRRHNLQDNDDHRFLGPEHVGHFLCFVECEFRIHRREQTKQAVVPIASCRRRNRRASEAPEKN
jgi:hypothetical protein